MRLVQAEEAPFLLSICLVLFLLLCGAPCSVHAAVSGNSERWAGVDETVVGKIAAEHGRETKKPMIDTDRGDLLLFVFLLAGAAGGFVAGYYWRKLMEQRPVAVKRQKRA